MPTIGRRDSGPFKEYGWLVIVIALFVGIWLTMPMMSGTGSGSVDIAVGSGRDTYNEQSLSAPDPSDNPQGAPGQALGVGGGAGGHAGKSGGATSTSSLYQAPGSAAGAPLTAEEAAQVKAGGSVDSLASAMAQVAKSGKAPDNSWGGARARSGFSRPKAKFGKVGATRGGGSGSTSAQYVVKKAFGTGGDPGLNFTGGGSGFSGGPRGRMNRVDGSGAGNKGLSALKNVKKANLDALKGGDEMASGGGRRTFDASGGHTSAMSALQSAGGAAGLNSDAGVPQNLKGNDFSRLNKREFKPPELKAKEVEKSDNQQYMQQKMMMMLMQTMLTGVMGPMGGVIAQTMQMGMMMQQPSD